MLIKIPWKMALWALAIVVLLLALIFAINYLANFPKNYPDRTLVIGEKATAFFQQITLPIKLLKLAGQPPDEKLLMPVYGVRVSQVADTFLSERPDGRSHEGQDMFASRGTPIFSATKGYITRITDRPIGGRSIFVTGAGGRRYFYTHLERYAEGVNVGDAVTTDTIIGFVGNDGNAATTPTHLHFGVYIGREAINPISLLVDRP